MSWICKRCGRLCAHVGLPHECPSLTVATPKRAVWACVIETIVEAILFVLFVLFWVWCVLAM
jgi:hypothetical protein